MQYFLQVVHQNLLNAFAAVFMAVLGAYFALRVSKSGRHASACEKFRASVHAALVGLYPSPVDWPTGRFAIIEELEDRFVPLDRAVSEFAYHLPPWRRLLFKRAWCLYRLGNPWRGIDGQGQNYWQYVGIKTEAASFVIRKTHDNTLTYKANFKHNIGRLLSYARET